MTKKLLVLLVLLLLLSSCLEVDSFIDLKIDGTGTWTLKYRLAQEAFYITPGLEFSEFSYFPVNEDEFRKRISEISGLELLQLSIESTAVFIEYSAEIKFQNTDDIELFFNNDNKPSIIKINSEGDGLFSLTINNPFGQDVDQYTIRLLSALYSENKINIVVGFPGIVTNSSTGNLYEDPEKAGLEIKTTEILTMTEEIKWVITYE